MTSHLEDVPRRRLSEIAKKSNGDDDLFAELLVAEIFDAVHDNDQEWFDVQAPNGTKFEAKSAQKVVDTRDKQKFVPGTGRFRLWEDQHRSLAAAASNEGQTAWYVFVLFDDDRPVDVRRMRPSTVTSIVHDDGGAWNRAGHTEREGNQHKIPWKQVMNR